MTPSVETTSIPGLLVVRLDLRHDDRGWFEEVWQPERMTPLGLPDFSPVQANVAWNDVRGTTRGIHAEPWDKLVTISAGRAYGAWVDLRAGSTFGTVFGMELEPGIAVFVPRGVGNGYQTTADGTACSYLVSDHWRPDLVYAAIDHADPALAIVWPIPPEQRVLSDRDRTAPPLASVEPLAIRTPIVLGADGQVGRALLAAFPGARGLTRADLDLTDRAALEQWPWREHDVVLNAAAYTAVDDAETPDGRRTAWSVNAGGPATLAALATPARLHAGPLLDRLRLRRPDAGARRGGAGCAAGGLRAEQGGRRRGGRDDAPALRRTHVVGDRRRAGTSSAR